MQKLKIEKLQNKYKFYKLFNTLTRGLVYLPLCVLIGGLSSLLFSAIWARLLFSIFGCLGCAASTHFIWSRAEKKAKTVLEEMEEYADTEQGEKEVVLMANIEAVKEILSEKDCKIKPTCERLLKRLLDTKYKMANKPKIKCKDPESGEVMYGEILNDKEDDINLDDMLYKSAEETGFFNTDEE